MSDRYDFVTFDCYGTLIDWEEGFSSAFREAAASRGLEVDREAVVRQYHEIEPLVESGNYRSYREVLREVAVRLARIFDWDLAQGDASFLSDTFASWKPFPDTNAALEKLRDAGYRLGILSNVDDDLLALTRRHFKVDFDLIVTAQQVQSYKPKLAHFVAARERLGDARWLHAAQSWFHDIVPACAFDVPVAWVNRKHEPPTDEARADYEVHDLEGLAAMLT